MRGAAGAARPLVVFLLIVTVWAPAGAQNGAGGESAAIVLELPASARALALGGAYSAAGEDEAAIFYNPAQLAALGGLAVGLSVQRYIASTTLAALAAATRLGPGTVGVGVQVLDYGRVDEVVPDPASGGQLGLETGATVSASDYAASIGYALGWTTLRFGVAAKLTRQRLAGESAGTGALDIGGSVLVFHRARVAVAVQNLGGDVTIAGARAPLPRLVRLGTALPLREAGPVRVLAAAELSRARSGSVEAAGGVEVSWTSARALTLLGRAGLLGRPAGSDLSPLSFGGGIRARRFTLDYAYQGFETLGNTHRVGVRWQR